MKSNCNVCNRNRQFKNPKIYIFRKTLNLFIVHSKCGPQYKKISEKEDPFETLKIFGLVTNIEEHQETYNHVWRKQKSRI